MKLNSLPESGISQILGLVELLLSQGGRAEISKLTQELGMELGDTLTVIRGAELLGLVHTPGGEVVTEEFAIKVLDGSVTERKDLIREKLNTVLVFKNIRDFLSAEKDHEVTRDEVLEKLAELIPNEDAEISFTTLVNWGRYSEMFGYNDDSQTFYLSGLK